MLLDLISQINSWGSTDLYATILVMVTATFINVLYFVALLTYVYYFITNLSSQAGNDLCAKCVTSSGFSKRIKIVQLLTKIKDITSLKNQHSCILFKGWCS